jgi:3-hydroxybutyryl-CoA dehydratase
MKAGDSLPVWRHRVEAAAMVPVAEILRDPNPIHLDPAAVAAIGLGDRVINQGPANLAYVVNMLAAAFPDHRLEALESRFLANVRADDLVEAGGMIEAIDEGRVTCDVWLNVDGGAPAVKGRAMLVPRG